MLAYGKTYYQTIINDFGDKSYYLNGNLHREGGPAIEYARGSKCWYKDGKRHREDGRPAVEHANGQRFYIEKNK